MIDNLDINTLCLSDLRSRLTTVTQDISIFKGSVQFNLDPFKTFEDSEIWAVLKEVGLSSQNQDSPTPEGFITSLGMELSEGGGNMSAGELGRYSSPFQSR